MVIIPAALPVKIDWSSENGKWKIVVKVDKEPGYDYLYSWMVVEKATQVGYSPANQMSCHVQTSQYT